jgi:hypothetical protein
VCPKEDGAGRLKKDKKKMGKQKAPITAFFALGEPSSAGADGTLFIEIEVVAW